MGGVGAAVIGWRYAPAKVVLATWVFLCLQQALAYGLGHRGPVTALLLSADDVVTAALLLCSLPVWVRRARQRWFLGLMVGPLLYVSPSPESVSGLLHSVPLPLLGQGASWAPRSSSGSSSRSPSRGAPSDCPPVTRTVAAMAVVVLAGAAVDTVAQTQWRELLGTTQQNPALRLGYRGAAVQSIFPNPGRYALFMATAGAVAVTMWLRTRSRWWGLLYVVSIPAAMASLR